MSLCKPVPTAIDSVISPADIPLLQFAYSDGFAVGAGTFVGNLFRKFRSTFGPSIDSRSLRHAALAWAAAFVRPQTDMRFWEQMHLHSLRSAKALMSKTESTVDLADLYATFLLTLLSGLYFEWGNFAIHLRGLKAILTILKDTISEQCQSVHLTIFLPLVRDMIVETSRLVPVAFIPNDEILEVLALFQTAIGPITHVRRHRYFEMLYGTESQMQMPFLQAIWHHTTTLRRCFRETLTAQLNGPIESDPTVRLLVTEIKYDLQSVKVREIINQLVILRSRRHTELMHDFSYAVSMFSLLLYQFCCYLIALLEEESIVGSLASIEVTTAASALLPLIDDDWLVGDLVGMPLSLYLRRLVVVRVLWMAGLSLNPKRFEEGRPSSTFTIAHLRSQVDYISN